MLPGMRPIPLRPAPDAIAAADRRTLTKAFTCFAVAAARQARPDEIRQGFYPGDDDVARVVRAAVSPASTANTGALQMIGSVLLPAIAPSSAALKLFKLGMKLDLSGVAQIKLPGILSVPPAVFIGEGQPAPAVQYAFNAPVIGPMRKILVQAAISGELESASAGSAETIVARALNESASKGIDAVAFSDDAATTAAPAGLVVGVVPIVSAGTGIEAAATDIAAAIGAMADAGIDGSDAVVIGPPALTVKLALLAGTALHRADLRQPRGGRRHGYRCLTVGNCERHWRADGRSLDRDGNSLRRCCAAAARKRYARRRSFGRADKIGISTRLGRYSFARESNMARTARCRASRLGSELVMTTDERSRWWRLREQARELLDAPVAPVPPRDPLAPDALLRWAERMPQPEPPPPERKPVPAPAPVDWHAEIERAVSTAIEAEHEFVTEIFGRGCRRIQQTAADDLERSVRTLTCELNELRAVLGELRATIATERIERTGQPLDLPRLPRGRDLN